MRLVWEKHINIKNGKYFKTSQEWKNFEIPNSNFISFFLLIWTKKISPVTWIVLMFLIPHMVITNKMRIWLGKIFYWHAIKSLTDKEENITVSRVGGSQFKSSTFTFSPPTFLPPKLLLIYSFQKRCGRTINCLLWLTIREQHYSLCLSKTLNCSQLPMAVF